MFYASMRVTDGSVLYYFVGPSSVWQDGGLHPCLDGHDSL